MFQADELSVRGMNALSCSSGSEVWPELADERSACLDISFCEAVGSPCGSVRAASAGWQLQFTFYHTGVFLPRA